MYCPTCGSEERQLSQYCRACGTDLRSVRNTLERPDAVTASAVSARDHISRAIADKIRETRSADELQKVVEEVLPEIEKFVESPQERRLRRIRTGVILGFIGLGAIAGGVIASVHDEGLLVLVLPGMVCFFIGLAIILNGLLLTVTRKQLPQSPDPDLRSRLDGSTGPVALHPADFVPAAGVPLSAERQPLSVTENTTKHLRSQDNS